MSEPKIKFLKKFLDPKSLGLKLYIKDLSVYLTGKKVKVKEPSKVAIIKDDLPVY